MRDSRGTNKRKPLAKFNHHGESIYPRVASSPRRPRRGRRRRFIPHESIANLRTRVLIYSTPTLLLLLTPTTRRTTPTRRRLPQHPPPTPGTVTCRLPGVVLALVQGAPFGHLVTAGRHLPAVLLMHPLLVLFVAIVLGSY